MTFGAKIGPVCRKSFGVGETPRYTLLRALGSGPMGEVWLARDELLDELAALRFLSEQIRTDGDLMAELQRQTARAHRLTHPNIIRIHDLHEEGPVPFLAMEYIEGASLDALRQLQPNKALPWKQVRLLLQQLCAALECAHAENIVHRHLAPSNLMLDGRGMLKIADFGIWVEPANRGQQFSAEPGLSHSTRESAQRFRKSFAIADDIHAIGAIAYELLSGTPPFQINANSAWSRAMDPEPLDQRMSELGIKVLPPPEATSVIMDCLASEPAQRPLTAREIANELGLHEAQSWDHQRLAEALFPAAQPDRSGANDTPKADSPTSGVRPITWALAGSGAVVILALALWQIIKNAPPYVDHRISLESVANFKINHLLNPPIRSFRTKDGISFSFGRAFSTHAQDKWNAPAVCHLDLWVSNPASVHLLINSSSFEPRFTGFTIGEVALEFSDSSRLTYPIVAGQTVREKWQNRNGHKPIPGSFHESVSLVEVLSQTRKNRDADGIVDMLSIQLPGTFRAKTLTGIRIADLSNEIVHSSDPGLLLMGITVRSINPSARMQALQPDVSEPEPVDTIPAALKWNLHPQDATTPETLAAGRIHGRVFICNEAVLFPGALTLHGGDGGLTIRFPPSKTNAPAAHGAQNLMPRLPDGVPQQIEIEPQQSTAPEITMRWKSGDEVVTHSVVSGYLLKLTFGEAGPQTIPGRIYVALPDDEQSFIAGVFDARVNAKVTVPRKKR